MNTTLSLLEAEKHPLYKKMKELAEEQGLWCEVKDTFVENYRTGRSLQGSVMDALYEWDCLPIVGINFKEEPKMKDMNEQQLEAAIQAKGLNAPRLKPEDIDAEIVSETFTILPSGKVMVCELILKNGFSVRGESAVVSPENFNKEIGMSVSRKNARNKVWELKAYLLQETLFQQSRLSKSEG